MDDSTIIGHLWNGRATIIIVFLFVKIASVVVRLNGARLQGEEERERGGTPILGKEKREKRRGKGSASERRGKNEIPRKLFLRSENVPPSPWCTQDVVPQRRFHPSRRPSPVLGHGPLANRTMGYTIARAWRKKERRTEREREGGERKRKRRKGRVREREERRIGRAIVARVRTES